MELKTFVSMFSGVGGWDLGAVTAGLEPLAAYELNPNYARAYASVFGDHVHVGDIADASPPPGRCDVLFSSPPCQNFSYASAREICRSKPESVDARRDAGLATVTFARSLWPKVILIENVVPYAKSEVFGEICGGLPEYEVHIHRINAAHFGVPSSRKRMVAVLLRRDIGCGAFEPGKSLGVGWDEAVSHIIPALGTGRLATWQRERLLRWDLSSLRFPLLISGYNCSSSRHRMNKRVRVFRESGEPAMTVVKSKSAMLQTYIMTERDVDADVIKADYRCFAAWQSFPPDFIGRLDEETRQSPNQITEMVGNAVPPKLSCSLISSLKSL